jgi:hypothetical protein
MKPIAFIVLLLILPGSTALAPHKFEDGFVERTMAVIIRDDTAYVEYSVGLNETTLTQIVEEWESREGSADENSSDAGLTKPAPNGTIDSPKSSKDQLEKSSSPATNNIEKAETANSNQPPLIAELSTPIAKQPNPGDSNNQPTDQSSPTESVKDIHAIDAELLAKFRMLAVKKIPKNLAISYDGNPIELEAAVDGPPPRHPFTMTIKFKFKLPQSQKSELTIADNNFKNQIGAVRYSLKATGKSMIFQSNVAPILVRSERVMLGKQTNPDKDAQAAIDAELSIEATKVNLP